MSFLFDSGAKISLFSDDPELTPKVTEGLKVRGVGGSQLIGQPKECSIKFDCLPGKWYHHQIHPTTIPGEQSLVLLGTDFLAKFDKTLIDWKKKRISLGNSWVYLTDIGPPKVKLDISKTINDSQTQQMHQLVEAHPNLFTHNPKAPRQAKTGCHIINTKTELPHKDKVRRTPAKWKNDVDDQIKQMIENGICRESSSPYSSNILLTNKKDGTKRFCIDFRSLNSNTIKDTYPFPNVEDLIDSFQGRSYFSQIDLVSGYWGIPVNPHMGKFEMLRMPFGLCNAQATFQREMDRLKYKLRNEGNRGIDAYVDNIIVFSKTFEEHIRCLESLFRVADETCLSFRADKCEFAKQELQFLGFIINGQTVRPTPDNVGRVKEFPVPSTRRQLQQFLGLCNFNWRFIGHFADIAAPLSALTSTKVRFKWEEYHQIAFENLKKHLSVAPSLYLADFSKPFHIEFDASAVAVGAVLFQLDEQGNQQIIAYHSKTLEKAAKKWTATEKEMYGIISASRRWYPYCANKVIFHTDHQPLRFIRNQKDARGKIARWITELENLDYSIEYIPGLRNVRADCLSRTKIPGTDAAPAIAETSCVYASEAVRRLVKQKLYFYIFSFINNFLHI